MSIFDYLLFAFMAAVFIAVWGMARRELLSRQVQKDVARKGVEVEAEILARFEAEAPAGSELAKHRQSFMASWDPLELELRYVVDQREIVSRGRVSAETFFHTRGMKTLKIKVDPERPQDWTALS
jgi:hypothetical protein